MSSPPPSTSNNAAVGTRLDWLPLLGIVSLGGYLIFAAFCARCDYDQPGRDRPILETFVTLIGSFALYLAAIRAALVRRRPSTVWLILGFAVLFRVVNWYAEPFQEIDYYRYLWDGNCSEAGVNPRAYSPLEVRMADNTSASDADLRTLVNLRDSSSALDLVLKRIHFERYTSPYPPVSQVVFWFSAVSTPDDASLARHLLTLKLWLTAFDLGTMGIAWWLIRFCRLNVGWLVVYAWCPLVIKEIANSSHLDAIAVFFVTAALALATQVNFGSPRGQARWIACVASAVTLALGVGAKLYGVVLIPLVAVCLFKRSRWTYATLFCAVWIAATCLFLSPLITSGDATSPGGDAKPSTTNQTDGLRAFLTQWRMNDLIFMLIQENIKRPDKVKPWFVVVPDAARSSIHDVIERRWNSSTFVASRAICAVLYLFCVGWVLLRESSYATPQGFLEAAFLTLALFWMLTPTLNPWYWLWVMPLVSFARNRAWLLYSGFLFVYYTRFWFEYHADAPALQQLPYTGQYFFHYVIVWFEHLPVLIAVLAVAVILHRRTALNRQRAAPDN